MRNTRFFCLLIALAVTIPAAELGSGQEPARIVPTESLSTKRKSGVARLTFNPVTGGLAEATRSGAVFLWHPAVDTAGKKLVRDGVDESQIKFSHAYLGFSADGKFLGASYSDSRKDKTQANDFVMWDVASGKRLYRIETGGYFGDVTFHPKGECFALVRDGGTEIELRAIESGVLERVWRPDAFYVLSPVSFDPDGKRAAFATATPANGKGFKGATTVTVRIWDVASGKELLAIKGHTSTIRHVCFAAKGRVVATCSGDGTVCIWNAATGEKMQSLPLGGVGSSMTASPDGRWLAVCSVGRANNLAILDAETGKELAAWTCMGATAGLTFSGDGKKLAAANQVIQIWNLQAKEAK